MKNLLVEMSKFCKFNLPAQDTDFKILEKQIKLPQEFTELYSIHNGGEILGHQFFSIEEIISEIESASDLENDDELSEADVATSRIQNKRWMKNRIPILGDYSGNFIAIDCAPTKEGKVGQVINCGNDQDKLYVFADNIKDFFVGLLELVKQEKINKDTYLISYLIDNDISFIQAPDDIQNVDSLKNVPKKEITFELAYKIISEKPDEIAYVPNEILNKELCVMAVSKNPFTLKHICQFLMHAEYKHDVYKMAVNANQDILMKRKGKRSVKEMEIGNQEFISIFNYIYFYNYKHELISELYYDALQKDINVLYQRFLDKRFIDEKCYNYIISKMDFDEAIKYIPAMFKTRDKCLEVIKKDGMLIKYVPLAHRDKEMLMTAIRQNPEALQLLGANIQLQNEDVCIEAVSMNGMMLEYVYPRMRNEKVCKVAYENNSDSIQFMPDHIRNRFENA